MHRRSCLLVLTSSVHYTTSCKHSLVLLRMGEIIARNMLSWLKLLINCYYCILLVVYNIVSEMHGHTSTERQFVIKLRHWFWKSKLRKKFPLSKDNNNTNIGWFKKMDSISYVYISWTIHCMWMIYITFERGGPKFSNTTARALA